MSIWFPDFALERLKRDEPGAVPELAPFALAATEGNRLTVSAANPAALAAGIRLDQGLADARAIAPALISRPAEPARDVAALALLSRWTVRYGPAFNTDGADGLWVDVTGAAHFYGGEAGLLADLAWRLERAGFTARLGLADGLGAASALARYFVPAPDDSRSGSRPRGAVYPMERLGRDSSRGKQQPLAAGSPEESRQRPARTLPDGSPEGSRQRSAKTLPDGSGNGSRWAQAKTGTARAALAGLPVEALRLEADTARLLRRLGLKHIGQLYQLPRAALERRFRSRREAEAVLLRLDQALGLKPEPLRPMRVPPAHAARAAFPEPLISGDGLDAALSGLAAELCAGLAAADRGARRLLLTLHRSDGTRTAVRAGLSRPSRSPAHIIRLLREKLAAIDAGFGIDLMQLAASCTEPLTPLQTGLAGGAETGHTDDEALAGLIDRLAGRLGAARVFKLEPRPSHLPERAEVFVPALGGTGLGSRPPLPASPAARPPLLLPAPEPITAVAEVPEGPPALISWRRTLRRIVRAEGPERIAAEWWREIGGATSATRDYYVGEDDTGARFWLFRAGRHGDEGEDADRTPAWYLHGLF